MKAWSQSNRNVKGKNSGTSQVGMSKPHQTKGASTNWQVDFKSERKTIDYKRHIFSIFIWKAINNSLGE